MPPGVAGVAVALSGLYLLRRLRAARNAMFR
jgi:hypothetical protein